MNNTNHEVTVLESQQKPVGAGSGEYGAADGLKIEGVHRSRSAEIEMLVAGELATLALPLRYRGGKLVPTDSPHPWIEIADNKGRRLRVHSLEWLLFNIDLFAEGRDQDQPLACAAHHYELNTFALMGREHAESKGKTWAAQRGAA